VAAPLRRRWPAIDISFPPDRANLEELLAVALDGLGVTAVEETPSHWRVFFESTVVRDAALATLNEQLAALSPSLSTTDVDDEDWARRSQAALRAIRVGRVVIAPPWDVQELPDSDVQVVIEPSMGFGTGHHASTRLCLAHLQAIDLGGQHVLDIGAGSGVLAIAAVRLGAERVTALEIDPDAVSAARENLRVNDVLTRVRLLQEDFRGAAGAGAGVVVANLTGGMLARHAPDVLRHLSRPGMLLLGGITSTEATEVLAAFAPPGLAVSRSDEDGWVALSLQL
jgi:ribosomal protein L11 methyltransferase